MDKFLYIAASGAKQDMQAMALKANNLANARTTGFKADFAQARSMQAFGEGLPTRVFAMQERPGQNFDSGALITTGRDLDVAIKGNGWLAVQKPDGTEGYTRNGSLQMSPTGALETSDGHLVMGNAGPISLPVPVDQIQIDGDGTIMVRLQGAPATALEEFDRIRLVNPDIRNMEKGKDGTFYTKDNTIPFADPNVKVMGGALESSNVNTIAEMTSMISLQRHFEMQVKMMKTAEEIDQASASLMRTF